jgi:LPS sulfotransferase NodH
MEDERHDLSEWQKVQRDMSPKHDFPVTECRYKYLVCSTPRSGSTLLCTGLASTGLAGRPMEYYSPNYVKAYRLRIGSAIGVTLSEYRQFLLERRTSPNGVFGMKMHFGNLPNVLEASEAQKEFVADFDRLIFLERRNKLAQAVSFSKARATGVYRVAPGETVDASSSAAVPYSFQSVATALSWLADREAGWLSLLKGFGDRTISLTYEELARDYAGSMRRVLVELGLADAVAALKPRPQVLAQSDPSNRRWQELFVQELRDSAGFSSS